MRLEPRLAALGRWTGRRLTAFRERASVAFGSLALRSSLHAELSRRRRELAELERRRADLVRSLGEATLRDDADEATRLRSEIEAVEAEATERRQEAEELVAQAEARLESAQLEMQPTEVVPPESVQNAAEKD